MLLPRNLFTALIVAVVDVAAFDITVPSEGSMGWAGFCTGSGIKGTCAYFPVPLNLTCVDLGGNTNNSAHSFESTPGITCTGYE